MSSILRVRPTKIEFIRLRRRLSLAVKVHRILRERATILINEFLVRIRRAYRVRKSINREIDRVYREASFLLGLYGQGVLSYYSSTTMEKSKIIVGFENIMGVKSYTAMMRGPKYYEPLRDMEDFRKRAITLINNIIELGRIEQSLQTLGVEINKTKRRVNALEYIFIPRLKNTIRYLRMKFEEREREEKARMKRVKEMLEKHRR